MKATTYSRLLLRIATQKLLKMFKRLNYLIDTNLRLYTVLRTISHGGMTSTTRDTSYSIALCGL